MQIFDGNKQRVASGRAGKKLRQRLETTAFFLLRREYWGGNAIREDIGKLGQQLDEFGGAWPQQVGDLIHGVGGEEGA
jgi:hypothetical protein